MSSQKLPIGYWLKQADNLLTKGIDDIQASFGLTRMNWQVLNTIKEKEQITKLELITFLQPFADQDAVNATLTSFKTNLILIEKDENITLTGKGLALHAACLEKQKIFRQTATTDISEQQYEQAIATLQQIVKNLTKKE